MEEFVNNEKPEVTIRPRRLTILCILTFVFSGLGVISSILTPLLSNEMIYFLKESPNYDDALFSESIRVIQSGWSYYLPTAILAFGSLIGAVLMWKLKKAGFHLYAISNLTLLFIPTIVLGIPLSWSAIFVTVGFIGLYGMNFKLMK